MWRKHVAGPCALGGANPSPRKPGPAWRKRCDVEINGEVLRFAVPWAPPAPRGASPRPFPPVKRARALSRLRVQVQSLFPHPPSHRPGFPALWLQLGCVGGDTREARRGLFFRERSEKSRAQGQRWADPRAGWATLTAGLGDSGNGVPWERQTPQGHRVVPVRQGLAVRAGCDAAQTDAQAAPRGGRAASAPRATSMCTERTGESRTGRAGMRSWCGGRGVSWGKQ